MTSQQLPPPTPQPSIVALKEQRNDAASHAQIVPLTSDPDELKISLALKERGGGGVEPPPRLDR